MTQSPVRQRLLYVDDDPEVGRAFARAVQALNYEVDVVTSAGEAVERGLKYSYPVVVADLRLRGVDGYAVIDALGALHEDTAFIIVTDEATSVVPRRVRSNAAVSSLVTKPWDIDELAVKLQLAHRLHDRRSLERNNAAQSSTSVLIVEDSPTDALLLRQYLLTMRGVRLKSVSTLSAATVALHEGAFDVIFTDLSLPDARGVDTVFRLRSAGPRSAIVVCSGIEDQALTLQLLALGAHECIAKSQLSETTALRALMHAKERKAFELRLTKLAYHDPLTGVANRAGWHERASSALDRAARRLDRVAVILIDLDGFKQINDALGHDAGDSLLQEVASRLSRLIREYDIVARLGGDEFALMVSDLGAGVDVAELGVRIQRELAKPVLGAGESQGGIAASIGIAVFPDHGESLSDLVKAADAAMYRAKGQGKNCAVVASGRAHTSDSP